MKSESTFEKKFQRAKRLLEVFDLILKTSGNRI